MKIDNIHFEEFNREVFEKSQVWLNDPEIKRLTNTPDTDLASKEKWFKGLKERDDYYIRATYSGETPIGVVGLKHINSTDAELFLYIGEKEYWGKGIGNEMIKYVLNHGQTLGLSSLYALVLKENINSYKLFTRNGFKYEKDTDDHIILVRRNY